MSPIFHLAGINYEVIETTSSGDAKSQVAGLDLLKTDGIVVVGGDGLLQEVVTGLLRREDQEEVSRVPVGVIPVGSANMFARALHSHPSVTRTRLLGQAALTIAEHKTKKVDVMAVTRLDSDKTVYAMVGPSIDIFSALLVFVVCPPPTIPGLACCTKREIVMLWGRLAGRNSRAWAKVAVGARTSIQFSGVASHAACKSSFLDSTPTFWVCGPVCHKTLTLLWARSWVYLSSSYTAGSMMASRTGRFPAPAPFLSEKRVRGANVQFQALAYW